MTTSARQTRLGLSVLLMGWAFMLAAAEDECKYEYTIGECQPAPTPEDPNHHERYAYYYYPGDCKNQTKQPFPAAAADGRQTLDASMCTKKCEAGFVLGPNKCEECPSNTYSPGGGYWWWNFDKTAGFPKAGESNVFQTKCAHNRDGQWKLGDGCEPWQLEGDRVTSGNNTAQNSVVSIMSLHLTFVRTGEIAFTWKCDSEPIYDQLQFIIDDEIHMNPSTSVTYREQVVRNIAPGPHVFQWIYKKDISNSVGEDQAVIKSIRVMGTSNAQKECLPCPPGTASDGGQAQCSVCASAAFDTFVDKDTQTCQKCDENSYAMPGDTACKPKPECKDDDWIAVKGTCNGESLEISYVAKEPHICKGGTDKSKTTDTATCECNPGSILNKEKKRCDFCPEGTYRSAGMEKCETCPAGSEAPKSLYLDYFKEGLLKNVTFDCFGDCGTIGWHYEGTSLASGSGHGKNADVIFSLPVKLEFAGSVQFDFSVDAPDGSGLTFSIDGRGMTPNLVNGNGNLTFPLTTGSHELVWRYKKVDVASAASSEDVARLTRLILEGVETGGAVNCIPCRNGTFSSETTSHCSIAPAGSFSVEGAKTPTQCPKDTYSPKAGASECSACGKGFSAAPGAAQCNTSCTFDNRFSLVGTSDRLVTYKNDDLTLDIGLCEPSLSCGEEEGKHYACMERKIPHLDDDRAQCGPEFDLETIVAGNHMEVDTTDDKFTVTLTGGDSCDGVTRTTKISYECADHDFYFFKRVELIKQDDSSCVTELKISSLTGCRLCEDDEMEKSLSECHEGQQRVSFIRRKDPSNLCNWESRSIERSLQPCEESNSAVVYPLVAVTVVLVLSLGIVAARFFKLRKRHKMLKAQFGDRLLEVDAGAEDSPLVN